MIKILCMNEFEVNYIVQKYDYVFSNGEILDIITKLNNKGYIFLNKNNRFSYCSYFCNNCKFVDSCRSYSENYIKASNLTREEKLNRILND